MSFWDLVFSIGYACANFYAVFYFIWLLSHAIVELPRRLWYLPDSDTHRRYACFTAGVAYEDLDLARQDWEMAVDALVRGTAHLVADPATARAWRDHLRILRNEWRVTESTVRSMPIACGRWPCEPPTPPPPPTFEGHARRRLAQRLTDGSSCCYRRQLEATIALGQHDGGAAAHALGTTTHGGAAAADDGGGLPAWLIDAQSWIV